MLYHAGPRSLVFFAECLKWSRIVIYRSKVTRFKCSLNRSYINYGELHFDSVNSSLVFFYPLDSVSLLTGARSSSLGNSFWTTVFGVFCYFQTRVTCRPKSRCQSDLSTVSVLANKNLHQDLMHSGCRGAAVPKVCPQAFSLFPLPNSPLDQRPVHRLGIEGLTYRWTLGAGFLRLTVVSSLGAKQKQKKAQRFRRP